MEFGFLFILAFGFILGIKHAIEPDHIIAVSTIASQSRKIWRAALSGVFWGIGHTFTLLSVGVVVILVKGEIPEIWAMSFEFLVGVMLVYLGFTSALSFPGIKGNNFGHSDNKNVTYLKSTIIGLVHGLAGSAAMLLLTINTVKSVWEGIIYILVFGIGTVIGMLLFTTLLGIPFVMSSKNLNLNKTLVKLVGGVSIAFGFFYMYNIGINEGLFRLWLQ